MGLFVLLFARSRFSSVPSVPSVVKAFDFPHSEPRHAEDPRLVHQQNYYQALIKIYVRLVICPIYSVVKNHPRELTST